MGMPKGYRYVSHQHRQMNTSMHSFYALEMKKNVIAIKFEKQLTATKESRKYRQQESSGAIPPTGVSDVRSGAPHSLSYRCSDFAIQSLVPLGAEKRGDSRMHSRAGAPCPMTGSNVAGKWRRSHEPMTATSAIAALSFAPKSMCVGLPYRDNAAI